MASPIKIKQDMKETILQKLFKDGEGVYSHVVSSSSLVTGFRPRTIKELLDSMEVVGWIEIDEEADKVFIKKKGKEQIKGADTE